MPTLSELQQAYNNAVTAYQIASSKQISADTAMRNAHNAVGRCVCGKGKVQGQCRPLPYIVTLGQYANASDCKQPQSGDACSTDCCSKGTCEGRINAYNASIDSYKDASDKVSAASTIMDTAKAELQSHPDYIKGKEEEIQSGKTMRVVWIIAGIVVVVIIAGYFVFKFLKRK